jgi:hypothetical protein
MAWVNFSIAAWSEGTGRRPFTLPMRNRKGSSLIVKVTRSGRVRQGPAPGIWVDYANDTTVGSAYGCHPPAMSDWYLSWT